MPNKRKNPPPGKRKLPHGITFLSRRGYRIQYKDALGKKQSEEFSSLRAAERAIKHRRASAGAVKSVTTPKEHQRSKQLMQLLMEQPRQPYTSLSRQLNLSVPAIDDLVASLYNRGYAVKSDGENVVFHRAGEAGSTPKADPQGMGAKRFKIGVIGDTHVCSYYERLDVLRELYSIFAREGVKTVYHCGNIIDGRERFNLDEIKWWALDDQVKYLLDNYPQQPGITTRFITANHHEGWWQEREGMDIGRIIQSRAREFGRSDLEHIGYIEADVRFKAPGGETWMKLMHPRDGSAYALSYKAQKIVEGFQGGMKPRILLVGHYHKLDFCYPREVFAYSVGCVQDQTSFMRGKHIAAHVGGSLIEMVQNDAGIITKFKWEWIPFYDKNFYDKHDPHTFGSVDIMDG